MLTVEMRDIAQRVADRHNTYVYGVLMLAAAKGPSVWRGCVPITHDYSPKHGSTGNRPMVERPKRPKRIRHDRYEVDEDECAFDFL